MNERVNPFTPGPGLNPPYLAGREDEMRAFDALLENVARGRPSNMILHGLRGVGKTVLLRRFAGACGGKKFLPLARYQYRLRDSDPDEFTAGIKRVMRHAIESSSTEGVAKGRLRSAGGRLQPAPVDASGIACEPSRAGGRREPLSDHLVDYLAKNWKIIEGIGYGGAVFLLDEFHAVSDVKKDGWYALTDFLGAVNEAQKDGCRYSLVLSGLPSVLKNVKMARPYAERMFGLVEVPNLSRADGRRAIVRPLASIGVEFAPALVDAVVEDSARHPYFIQFFACEILRRIAAQRIGMKEYKTIRGDLVRRLYSEFFDRRLAGASHGEKSTLYHMSGMPEDDMRFTSIVSATGRSKGAISSYLKRLEQKGLIYRRRHGHYAFALPLLKPYLSYARRRDPPKPAGPGKHAGLCAC